MRNDNHLDYFGLYKVDLSEEKAEHKFELLTLEFLYCQWREKSTSVRV